MEDMPSSVRSYPNSKHTTDSANVFFFVCSAVVDDEEEEVVVVDDDSRTPLR